jgi:hypothetical protein
LEAYLAEVANEMIYEEILKLDASIRDLENEMQETLAVMRETNRQLAAGQARNDALKRRLFGDRFVRTSEAQ